MPGEKHEGSEIKSAYTADHDLRAVFTRENTERRRQNGATLRKHLTTAQERKMTQAFVPIRTEYEIRNNSDAVIVWVQQQLEGGASEDDFTSELVELAKSVTVAKRTTPWDDETGQ